MAQVVLDLSQEKPHSPKWEQARLDSLHWGTAFWAQAFEWAWQLTEERANALAQHLNE